LSSICAWRVAGIACGDISSAFAELIRGVFDGDAIFDAFSGPVAAEITYTVIVK